MDMQSSVEIEVPPLRDDQLAKCLFLTSKPDQRSAGDSQGSGKATPTENGRTRLIRIFQESLIRKSVGPVRHELGTKLLDLQKCESPISALSPIEKNFSETEQLFSDAEEDILELNEIFRMLSVPIPEFLKNMFNDIVANKRIAVPKASDTPGENEDFKTFFIYTEYKLFSEICDVLTSDEVYCLYRAFQGHNRKIQGQARANVDLELEENSLKETAGLKDVAFYYLILKLVEADDLNRLHTHALEYRLKYIMKTRRRDDHDVEMLQQVLLKLRRYPVASHPPGLCIIFCVVTGREGAREDFQSVEKLFRDRYNFDVVLRLDPTSIQVKSIALKLHAQKHKFYDSLVVWFMGHGDLERLQLLDGQIDRREFFDVFSKIPWLCRKPKLFFIQACAKQEMAAFESQRGEAIVDQTDASSLGIRAGPGWKQIYGSCIDTSYINYFADTLISYATRWYEPAARNPDHGSIYVQTIVDQLTNWGHKESIENVLRKVHYNVNVVKLKNETERSNWKQSPYYESSLQKEFVFPYSSTDKQQFGQDD